MRGGSHQPAPITSTSDEYGHVEHQESRWRPWLSWYSIYYALSGYGERPWRGLVWLMAFLFGFSGLVWLLGLSVDDYGNTVSLWDSIVYILQKSSLQRPEWPKANSLGTRFWSSLSVLFIPGQAPCFCWPCATAWAGGGKGRLVAQTSGL